MARYFFTIVDGHTFADEEGIELPNLEAVRTQALRCLAEFIRDDVSSFWCRGELALTVSEADGSVVLRLQLSSQRPAGL